MNIKVSKDPWFDAKTAHQTCESLRKVCVAWYNALDEDLTEVAAWSDKGCTALAEYLETDGRGARVERMVVGADKRDPRVPYGSVTPVIIRLLKATPNLMRLFASIDSGNIDFLRLVPRVSHLSLRADSFSREVSLLLPHFANHPNILHLHLTGNWTVEDPTRPALRAF